MKRWIGSARAFALAATCVMASGTPVWAAPPVCPNTLRIALIDFAFPPYMFGKGDAIADPPGKHVEWILSALEASNCKPALRMVRMPVARMRVELADGTLDMLVAGSDNPEIRDISAMPLKGGSPDPAMRVQAVEYGLYVMKGQNQITWDGRNLVGPPGFRVGVTPLVAASSYAHERGWRTEQGQSPTGVFKMLQGGRMHVAFTSDTAYLSLPEAERAEIQKLEPTVLVTNYYPVASKAYYEAYPEFVTKFWRDLVKAARKN
ncbi:hypothetical protein RQP54_16760 [Curvibacter sp. APW13]|uniref:hypothetical protein n=1 Tax=Curvibacter sp. APW13 TaxID=3077236 RepID=UPI0028DF500A|nr:hypothetical protein [Curvibacter sp. APW13]MDT8992524.1 hypothetical protein [Curvibacter sp. APW13]